MVERFEAFVVGMEIANGFSELNDADDQLSRFQEQVRNRAAGDERLSRSTRTTSRRCATACRRPAASALGIDRSIMLLADRHSIRDVILFPALRS